MYYCYTKDGKEVGFGSTATEAILIAYSRVGHVPIVVYRIENGVKVRVI